jgi:hypothetical protein
MAGGYLEKSFPLSRLFRIGIQCKPSFHSLPTNHHAFRNVGR